MAVQDGIHGPLSPGGGKATLLNCSDEYNYFCSVSVGKSSNKVLLLFSTGNPLGPLLLRKCLAEDYHCSLLHSQEGLFRELGSCKHGHCIVAIDTYFTAQSPLASLTEYIHAHNLYYAVTLVAVLSRIENTRATESAIKDLQTAGFSRVMAADECQDRFLWELQLLERTEVQLKQQLRFCHALFEAVEHSNDAIQITGPDSNIMYVNRSFLDMSGETKDDTLGKPAMDILSHKWDTGNGPTNIMKREQWEGPCLTRRKSGSQLRQHLKVIPVKSSTDYVTHHVTIQKLLNPQDFENKILGSKNGGDGHAVYPQIGIRKPARLEVPAHQVIQYLNSAKDSPVCPPEIKDSLDKAMEALRSPDLYLPVGLSEVPQTRGIVQGLLMSGRPSSMVGEPLRIPHVHHHLRHIPVTPPPYEVQQALKNIDRWGFDIISLEEVSGHDPLYFIGMKIFKDFEVGEILNVEDSVLAAWFKLVESNYHRVNTYHNSTHAADVLQATAYFIRRLKDFLITQGDMLEQTEVAALLISAVIHDLDHPGRTNPFLCNSRHALAVLYNDDAVLENHHVAQSFKLTQENRQANIFQSLDIATYRQLRISIIDLVLATDMAKHFEHLAKFSPMLAKPEEIDTGSNVSLTGNSTESRENRAAMKRILVKCADISNACRPQKLCRAWAERIAEEYFAQTEEEKIRGLPVVFPDFDSKTCKLPATQVKFIDYFVLGLFQAWNGFCPIPVLMEHLSSNYDHWKSLYDSPTSSEEEPDASSNSV